MQEMQFRSYRELCWTDCFPFQVLMHLGCFSWASVRWTAWFNCKGRLECPLGAEPEQTTTMSLWARSHTTACPSARYEYTQPPQMAGRPNLIHVLR